MDIKNLKHIQSSFYYDCSLVKRGEPVFFHVGTFTGNLEKNIHKLYPKSKIYCIEPHPENFRKLKKNTVDIKENIIYINKALVSDEAIEFISLYGQGSCATTYKKIYNEENIVSCTTIKKIISEFKIDNIDVVFFNAEGSEMSFIPHLIDSGMANRVDQVCLNFHTHVPGFSIDYKKVFDMLEKTNIQDTHYINDDRQTMIASQHVHPNLSIKYPCFLFTRKDLYKK